MERNLPTTRPETGVANGDVHDEPLPRRQPISVAFMPLALWTFITLAFVIAAWTFLAAGA